MSVPVTCRTCRAQVASGHLDSFPHSLSLDNPYYGSHSGLSPYYGWKPAQDGARPGLKEKGVETVVALPIDTARFTGIFCAVPPAPRVANRETGQLRVDRETGKTVYQVGLCLMLAPRPMSST